ncbi:twin-arginine translocation signal domain-containing protein [Nocardia sp. JW2]|uniref:twin-arginine translocation signal domain-containing protein n=1 Tax=Nocardia sp. JW2 TaxID=3450738 RepID=UPI003F42D45F
MRISRRGFLRAGIAVGAAVAVGAGVPRVVRPGQPGLLLPSAARLPVLFQTRLPMPPELAPFRSDATTDYYEIIQRTAQLDILPGLRTEAWTYHGSFPDRRSGHDRVGRPRCATAMNCHTRPWCTYTADTRPPTATGTRWM